ncbi:MAG: Rieske 2Fe-2S domain-containing protein [Bacteroidetes bacterium]|nr:Rieske 2Fe-2S domain-containing protein [Bacteroidota bacterium]
MHGDEPQALYSVRTIDVNDKMICLGRLPDGYFAVSDKCPHAAGRLGIGQCDHDGKVICPYHRYKYDLKTGKGDESQGDFVQTFPVETRKDGVYIGFETGTTRSWWKLW